MQIESGPKIDSDKRLLICCNSLFSFTKSNGKAQHELDVSLIFHENINN
jgi:hypothetical protein